MAEVNGRRLCAQVRGRGPTVVLDGGGTGQGIDGGWGRELDNELPEMATVVTYDRAGVGRSEGRQARTIAAMADDLHELVHATGASRCPLPGRTHNRAYRRDPASAPRLLCGSARFRRTPR
ncbi:hypothetical protein GCM10027570_41160 [Streptomonospora sediminis]